MIIEKKKLIIGASVFFLVLLGVLMRTYSSDLNLGVLSDSNSNLAQTKNFSLPKQALVKTCTFQTQLQPTRNKVIFKEIAWMGDKDSPNNEWITIVKIVPGQLDISGWQILNQNEKIKITMPQKTILTDEKETYVLARTEGISEIKADIIYSGAMKNTDEGLRLFQSNCNLEDEVLANSNWPAGNNTLKQTMKRDVKTLGWYTLTPLDSSKTKTNTTTVTVSNVSSGVLISEVMAGIKDNPNYEYIVIYNTNSVPVDLTGWAIKKKSSSGSESVLVSSSHLNGKIIPSGKYFLLANETGYTGAVKADVLWPHSYLLSQKNNAVEIYNANGVLVDSTSWGEIPEGQIWKRVSWSSSDFVLVKMI